MLSPGNMAKDRELLHHAKVIYGAHGGAMPINMMFMKPGGHMIEIVDLLSTHMMPYCCQPYHTYSANAMDHK